VANSDIAKKKCRLLWGISGINVGVIIYYCLDGADDNHSQR